MSTTTDGKGRWALVTGASAGIGSAFAQVFAEHGFSLVLSARREDRLRELARELEDRHGVGTLVVPDDLADPLAPQRIYQACETKGVTVDALVNNAGYGARNSFSDAPWRDHAAFLQVLVTSVVHLTHLFQPGMVERGWGRILNVASIAGLLPGAPRRTLYGPAKAFVVKFSEALALEHNGDGVHVTAVCPGFTYSEFHDVVGNREQVSRLPKFLWMDADTVARQGYAAVMRGDPVYVNGAVNRAVSALSRLMPQRAARVLIRRQSLNLSTSNR
jgi:short-subunit dehydrogenase